MNTLAQSASLRNYRLFTLASASISAGASLMVLTGWWLHIPAFTSIVPGLVTMKPNTAFCFLLISVALLLLRTPMDSMSQKARLWAARVCSSIAILIGTGSFIERLTGRNLGIDLIFFRRTLLATHVPNPGLMAAAAGLAFALMGSALLLLDWETSRKRRPAQGLAFLPVVIGFIYLLGYIYGLDRLFGAAGYAAVALNTAVIFMLLGMGILYARPQKGLISVLTSRQMGGLMARRLMPVFVILPLLVGWLRMRGQQAGLYQPEFGAALFSGAYILILVVLVLSLIHI